MTHFLYITLLSPFFALHDPFSWFICLVKCILLFVFHFCVQRLWFSHYIVYITVKLNYTLSVVYPDIQVILKMPLNPDEILAWFGGTTINDLNNVLDVSEDANPDDDISTLSLTQFLATHELANYLQSHKNEFSILSLNVQSIRAKFDQLSVVLPTLYNEGLSFSVICFQETCLREDDDITPFLLPSYNLVH